MALEAGPVSAGLKVFLFLLVAALAPAPTELLAGAGEGSRPLRVALVGDSLTQGGDWGRLLPGFETRNFGVGGDTTAMILKRLEAVVAAGPDVIFLQAGINDFSRKGGPGLILENHREIWRRLRAGRPEADLYVLSLLPVVERKFPGWNEGLRRFNRELARAAESEGLAFIDLYFPLADGQGQLRPEFTFDGLHLKAPAYEIWAGILRKALENKP